MSAPEYSRQELDPDRAVPANVEQPETPAHRKADDPDIVRQIDAMIETVGGEPESFDAKLVRDLVVAGLKLIPDGRDTGELKLMTAAVKELRYAYRVFAQYAEPRKATIFGSARTQPEHPDYKSAVEFSRLIAESGWMVITGAGDGIMKAGHVGPGREASFGVAIRLPFETTANEIIKGDAKLIHFRYFFTRKLMFLSQADAVVLFPGGYGTMDEAFETLTLVQTGKGSTIPLVMLEGDGQNGNGYWHNFKKFLENNLVERGLVNPEDIDLFYIASSPKDAVDHLIHFYRNYHSSRYVRDDLVIRLNHRLRDEDVARLGRDFAVLIKEGALVQRGAYEVERDHLDLPRLAFTHTRHNYGLIRKLIDAINDCDPADG
jgi:uncharacterized protein (TIGR00730 family)